MSADSSAHLGSFQVEVPAKWVLTGEHAVLRGCEAIAFPYSTMKLSLSYRPSDKEGTITANPFQSQIRSVIGRASEFLKTPLHIDESLIEIQSQIPVGAGLGSSAALSVAMAKMCLWAARQNENQLVELATHLEDLFHGKSSGMDVSAIAAGTPILYSQKNRSRVIHGLGNMPRFELYDSGRRGATKECIQKVKHWQQTMPHLRDHYDEQMAEATRLAHAALLAFSGSPREAENQLAHAMNLAQQCFETWGLVTPELMEQKYELLKQGALAVKITGAGLGGFWVALWKS